MVRPKKISPKKVSRSEKPQARQPARTGILIDRAKITSHYHDKEGKFRSLLDEVVFVLRDRLTATDIKLHSIEHRVKTLDSLLGKCEREVCAEPFSEFSDIVGARVICLFKDDLDKIGSLIRENFEVVKIDDKRLGGTAPLGYLSVHYTCSMPSRYKGPRYDQTRGIFFEIQVRTLCMHCWAAVSHYIDYKGDWDIPEQHKMSLSALAGLFYVADNEFQQFYISRLAARSVLEGTATDQIRFDNEINLDTLGVYLGKRFPDREGASDESLSQFVQKLKRANFRTIGEIDTSLNRAVLAMEKFEKEDPPVEERPVDEDSKSIFTRYNQIGAARVSLGFISSSFRKAAGKDLVVVRDKKYTSLVRRL